MADFLPIAVNQEGIRKITQMHGTFIEKEYKHIFLQRFSVIFFNVDDKILNIHTATPVDHAHPHTGGNSFNILFSNRSDRDKWVKEYLLTSPYKKFEEKLEILCSQFAQMKEAFELSTVGPLYQQAKERFEKGSEKNE